MLLLDKGPLSKEASRNQVSVRSIRFKMSVFWVNDVVCNTVPLVFFLYHVRPNSPISLNESSRKIPFVNTFLGDSVACTCCVQVIRSPKEAFAAAMQSWLERCKKCVCLQGDYVEKLLHFQLPVVSSFFK